MQRQIVGKHAEQKQLQSNILQISQEAKAMKAKYDDVIDATVGMLHHEDGRVCKFQTVEELLMNLTDPEMYAYAPVRGTKDFSEGAFEWVFGPYSETIRQHFFYSVIPTTGGSGAISNSFYNFNDFGQKVLIPNYYWTPYENFAFEANISLKTYLMYDENNQFNIHEFQKNAHELAKEQHRLSVLLNDPCNNPTGLCMTDQDWKEVIQTLNDISRSGVPVVLIHDIAYIDYQLKPAEYSRDVFKAYLEMDPEILAIVVFSGSKTFSMYGFRIGAQIGLSKNKDILDQFVRVGDYSVRARFSSVSQPAMNVIGKIFTNPIYRDRFKAELVVARQLLKDRAALFVAEAEKQQLDMLPYCGGFFISIVTQNPNIFQDLTKDHVYVIAMKGLIRIAISSSNLKDIPNLVTILKKHI
jgi:aspartate/tyrosine/aromatic aminotransferase